ncbi:unnamed protein product [Colias eurytheme]|nr:unnamed protein product [Colias eurytheme]
MKENQRKCVKCGRSPAKDSRVKLYRFPRPGTTNMLRCELWAKYCFPDKNRTSEFLRKLFTEHYMLCDQHFKPCSFRDYNAKKLLRSAVPEDVKRVVLNPVSRLSDSGNVVLSNKDDASPGTSRSVLCEQTNIVINIASQRRVDPTPGPSFSKEEVDTKPGSSHLPQEFDPNETISKQRYYMTKCRKFMQKICKLRNTITKLKNDEVLKALDTDKYVQLLSKYITPSLALILQGEIKNFRRKEKGRRWTKEQKITALRIYKRSPTCYNLLRRLIILPSPSSLKKLLQLFDLKVGINKKIFEMLKKVSKNLKQKDNEFILSFDEISIRKHLLYNNKNDLIDGYQDHGLQGRSSQVACYALVFMLSGIRKQIKQPVAFYLSGSSVSADRLSVLIKEVLYHCFEVNINVSATVCDMDGVNRKALGTLGATPENPQIEIYNHNVVTLFDAPHLLKCFRNLFMKYNIKSKKNISSDGKVGEGIAKWTHIKEFYDLDSQNDHFVFAPKLRTEHLAPNSKQKMRVSLAAQVLSHSVAAGMYCKIAKGELPQEAIITADLIVDMDNLFDCLNSDSQDLKNGKKCCTNMNDRTPHIQLFKKMKSFFQNMEFVGCRSKPPSLYGWIWTINGVEQIWQNIKQKYQISSLCTRKLQQDPLENLFGIIRGNCGANTNPTTGQFIAALKTAVLSRLATTGAKGTNCETDHNEAIINNFKTLFTRSVTTEKENEDEGPVPFTIEFNIKELDGEEEMIVTNDTQACAYVAGFILKKIDTKCNDCKESLYTKEKGLEHLFIEMKEYDTKDRLKYGSNILIKTIELCSKYIKSFLEKNSHLENIKSQCTEILLKTIKFDFIKCMNHRNTLIKIIIESIFYICMKRFCSLKNRQFIVEASAAALKKKIKILKHV